MKRGLFFSVGLMIAVLLCTASVTHGAGQNARLGALGVGGDLLEDPLNVGMYPSNTPFWTHLVTADVGQGDQVRHSLWGAWKIKGWGTLGLGFVGKQDNYDPGAFGNPSGNMFSLYWGGEFGKSAGIGAVLDYSGERDLRDTERTSASGTNVSENEENSSIVGGRAGFHMPIGPFRRVDLSVGYVKHSWDHAYEEIHLQTYRELNALDMSTDNLDLNLRAFSRGSGPVTFVPSLHLEFGSRDGEQSLLEGPDLDDGDEYDIGGDSRSYSGQLGVQVEVSKKTIVYASIGGRHDSYDTDKDGRAIEGGEIEPFDFQETTVETSRTDLPHAAVGIEALVRDWLTLRFGASKIQRRSTIEMRSWQRHDDVSTTHSDTREENYSRLNLAYGFAVEIGSLTLDAVFNDDFLYDWGYIVSGERQSPMTEVSVTYTFD